MANTVIGRVVATEKNPTTIDMFLVMRFVPFTTCSWVSMLVRKG